MAENLGNDFSTTLASGIADGVTTSITVASGSGAPAANFRIRIDNELMLVTSVGAGTNWTVTRGIEGTSGVSHSNGAPVVHVITKGGLDQYNIEQYLNAPVPTASGTDTYAANYNPALTGYQTDRLYAVKFTNANTGASTLALNGLSAIPLKNSDGTALAAGTIKAGATYIWEYNGTNMLMVGSAGGGGSSALSGITAATGANTIASGNNTGQVWNWAVTADSVTAMTLGETSAATAGTSTSGVPNQVLLKLSTLASSTMSPLSVYSRGSHVFSVSPSTPQILAANGTSTEPAYSFASNAGTGMSYDGSLTVTFSLAGTNIIVFDNNNIYASKRILLPSGLSTSPSLMDITNGDTGLFWPAANVLGVGNSSDGEWVRFASRIFQVSRGSADATSYAINARKSRGSVASPTVITTGDDLLNISGYGYVGATNQYKEAARILFDSTGTIADSTSGIGGIIRFLTAKAGTDTTPQEGFRLEGGSTPQILAADGSQTAPIYSFASDPDTGIFRSTARLNFVVNGTIGYIMDLGGYAATTLFGANDGIPGTMPYAPVVSVVSTSTVHNFMGLTAGGATDSVRFSGRFQRGTIASPIVITTGDDLLTLSGYGYVGATNTYLEAARILFDSTGTISDSTSGIGGIIRFSVANVGTVGVSEGFRILADSTHICLRAVTDGGIGNPAYSFASSTNTGMYYVATEILRFTCGGTQALSLAATGATLRITPRIVSMADATSITPTADTADQNTHANTQAAGTLTVNAPSGTAQDGQTLVLRIKSTNVQTYSFNAVYRGSTDIALPTSTTGSSKTDYLGFKYNSADSKWDLVAKVSGFT